MGIRISGLLVLIMIQYVLGLDSKNCSNSTEDIFARTAPEPTMQFYLFTNKNFYDEQEILPWNNKSLDNSHFNESDPTRILVHGWKNNLKSCFNGIIKDAYLKKGNFNVIVVDWGDWSRNLNYISVANLIFDELGDHLGEFTKFLNSARNVSFDNMYLIGHSLGAQMSGAAGQYIKPNKYNTIFGLDAAGPNFFTEDEKDRLDSGDANYVEQISTNMGKLGWLGTFGNASFYPNFGRTQNYCLKNEPLNVACSHSAAYWYFAETINSPKGFCGNSCPFYWHIYFLMKCSDEDCTNGKRILMGGEPSIPKNGTYYISVNDNPPFAKCSC